jgi:hypothetical protein
MLARIWYDAWMDATADDPTRAALAWLLASDEPAVRYLTGGSCSATRTAGPRRPTRPGSWRGPRSAPAGRPAARRRLRGPALQQEVVDWGRSGPDEMLALNALRVLRAAGSPAVTVGDLAR